MAKDTPKAVVNVINEISFRVTNSYTEAEVILDKINKSIEFTTNSDGQKASIIIADKEQLDKFIKFVKLVEEEINLISLPE